MQIVIVLRGLPGSGKSHLATVIRVSSTDAFVHVHVHDILCTGQ